MAVRLRKCPKCTSYTLGEKCRKCGIDTCNPHPPKFSLDDPFLEYKVKALISSLQGKINKKR
ncbi:MAG: nucleolar RNA-binding Nop10p family protein [Nitrososphaerota archaeon]|nr:nucleolar RNA-binding Nop10p family protein [Nitrososphaerota archaeon]